MFSGSVDGGGADVAFGAEVFGLLGFVAHQR
jgi:hypothetical protein